MHEALHLRDAEKAEPGVIPKPSTTVSRKALSRPSESYVTTKRQPMFLGGSVV